VLNERLVEDMKEMATAKNCNGLPGDWLPYYGPDPPPEARRAFESYIYCRWPIHVFALDPVNQEENIADMYSRRRETQLALSMAFASGRMSAGSFTRYTRRLETDMETIALNRTVVGFSHGTDTFGWRFYPRVQSPPITGNLTAFFRDLVIGGPTRNQDLRATQLEPGMRECVAIVLMPSFVPNVRFDTRSNWFHLTDPKCTHISMAQTARLSESIRRMQESAQHIADGDRYRAGEVGRMLRRVEQLSAELPLQTLFQQVPIESTLGGFAMFASGQSDLAPELTGFYGEPGVTLGKETTLFLIGDHFSVKDSHVEAGNRICAFTLLSRRCMRVTIPPDVSPVEQKGKGLFIDVHVGTPYGVTGHISIPVVGGCPDTHKFTYRWGLPSVYAATYTANADKTFSFTTNVLPPTSELIIETPDNMIFQPTATLRLTLTVNGKVIPSGVSDLTVAFDFQRKRFVLAGNDFAAANGNLATTLLNYFKLISPTGPPGQLTVVLSGRLLINTNTFVPIDSNVTISVGPSS
jgi:hypothetical protein